MVVSPMAMTDLKECVALLLVRKGYEKRNI